MGLDMTHKERVRAAICHKKSDRVPRGEMAIERELLHKLVGDQRYLAQNENEQLLAGIRELGADLVNIHQFPMEQVGRTPQGPIFRSVLGEEHVINHSTRLHKPAFDDISKARDYTAPAPSTCLTGDLDWFVANSDLFVFCQIMGPVSLLDWMLGTEDYLVWAMNNTEAIKNLTAKVVNYEISRARTFLDHGADAILITDDIAFNTGLFLPPHLMDELAWPFYRHMIAEIKAFKDVPVFLHTDGDIRAALDEIVACGFDGLQSLQPSAGMDIADVKRRYGDKICLMGNMDLNHLMPFGSPAEVAEQAAWLCENMGSNGGFILSTCNILTNSVPPENARAMYRADIDAKRLAMARRKPIVEIKRARDKRIKTVSSIS
jgi:uroporphyrinogen decarboxylase